MHRLAAIVVVVAALSCESLVGIEEPTLVEPLPSGSSGAGGSGGACAEGTAECDGDLSTECETLLGTIDNCSGCGDSCASPPGGAVGVCHVTPNGSMCAIDTCPLHTDDCDGLFVNGCETDLLSTVSCGSCTTVCPMLFACLEQDNSAICICDSNDRACGVGGNCDDLYGVVCVCPGEPRACQLGQVCNAQGMCTP